MTASRREILQSLTGGALVGAGGFLIRLPRADAQVTPDLVRFRPEIEPLVALLERTPREKCAAMLVEQLRRGVSYRQLLAALFLAGIRNVNPRPPGFAMHCVFVIHSAHLMSLEAPADARMLPLFYAADAFKASQQRDAAAAGGDFTLRALAGALPAPERAREEFIAAMEAWEPERAERAAVSLARHAGVPEVFELLWRYGARDYRNIGHKAIYVANAHRTLQAIGAEHAEPVLRSVVLALLDFGREQQVNGYALEDQCYSSNLKRAKETFGRLKSGWSTERPDAEATRAVLDAIRGGSPEEACRQVSGQLVSGSAQAGAVWDAVHLAAAELRMRARASGLVAVHAVTSANALRHAYRSSGDAATRLLLLLQAVGWMGQFKTYAVAREPDLRPFHIAEMEPAAAPPQSEAAPSEQVLAEALGEIPGKADAAAAKAFGLARNAETRQAFLAAAKRLVLHKADEAHYYKYAAALVEDIPLVSPQWQPHLTATLVYYLKGSKDPEPAAIQRAKEALRGLPA